MYVATIPIVFLVGCFAIGLYSYYKYKKSDEKIELWDKQQEMSRAKLRQQQQSVGIISAMGSPVQFENNPIHKPTSSV